MTANTWEINMAWYAKFDGVDGSSASAATPDMSDIVIVSDDTESSTTQSNPPSWGIDRIDQRDDPGNIEMLIKVLDGAAGPFYGAMTDVEYTLTVTDTATG